MQASLSDADWESMYAPYDQRTYQAVLDQLRPHDVVLDIGAGDLRLARQMGRTVRNVYAVEINGWTLDQADIARHPLPANVYSIRADARALDFPPDLTTGVLLMRHCTCFRLYVEKLHKAGAIRLITNARWHMHMEVVDFFVERKSFADTDMGWYACLCGGVGFKEGPPEHWTPEMDRRINEVSSCPQCMEH